MEQLVADLVARLHPPLAKPLTDGVEVQTPRGYGIVVGTMGDGLDSIGSATYFGPARQRTVFLLVELEGGQRVPFLAENLQVVERDGR